MTNFVLLASLFAVSFSVHSHGGRTNTDGCHHEQGLLHCHYSNAPKHSPQPVRSEPVRSDPEPEPYQSAFGTVDKPSKRAGVGLVRRVDYEGFTLWVDCSKRATVKFQYNAQRDGGNFKRSSRFFIDDKLPANCTQSSAKAYGSKYDRGHLVPANHLDHSRTAIKQSNTMANILPQAKNMNRGAWLMTEEITECYRDIEELLVIGGAIWSDDSGVDYFKHSHGVRTPSKFWKVIIRGVGSNLRVIAWIIPNSQEAKRGRLDGYLVSIDDIERETGEKIPVPDYLKAETLQQSWMIPRGCNKG